MPSRVGPPAQTNKITSHIQSSIASNHQPHHQHHHIPNHHNRPNGNANYIRNLAKPDDQEADDDYEGPPRKKQRLSHSHSHTAPSVQTTLDKFTQPKPPTKVTAAEPHGKLVQTLNGVRNELSVAEDELLHASPKPARRKTRSPQPAVPQLAQQQKKQEDKRTLRSQDDGPRLKSELQSYFPAYEDIIFDAPQEEQFLSVDTALYITDDATKTVNGDGVSPAKTTKSAANARRTSVNGNSGPPPLTPQRSSSNQFNGSPVLNLDFVANNIPNNPPDPLTDEHFMKSHKRAERKEKQLRNIEKERAMHEKVQLERLLEGLQGHDWLRVLGITGVTDSEAKKYEKKRDYFIAEVEALVDKFKQWKEQEKRQRVVKETAAAREAEEEEDSTEGSVEPPSSDLAASASRQLQQETVNAIKRSSSKGAGKGKQRATNPTSHPSEPTTPSTVHVAPPKPMLPPAPPSPEIPITSFYSKRHLRDAALGKSRHGRNVTAFGLPIPDLEEREFELPEDYVTEDALRSNARERRRRKRESAANSASKTS